MRSRSCPSSCTCLKWSQVSIHLFADAFCFGHISPSYSREMIAISHARESHFCVGTHLLTPLQCHVKVSVHK